MTVLRDPDAAPRLLKLRDDVFPNDRIITGPRSLINLLLGGATVVMRLLDDSTAKITQKSVHVEVARMMISRMYLDETFEVRTRNAVARVTGTTLVTEVARCAGNRGVVSIFTAVTGRV